MPKVLVTGGAGFLGRAILREVLRKNLDWDVTVYSRNETTQDEARRKYPFARYILGDIRDYERLTLALVGHDYVVAGGAVKYIPEAEFNASECVSVNVIGSSTVASAARAAGVRRVVGISTDKACVPVNVYGATKMLMERIYGEASIEQTRFTCVRYGNVIGSTGSVVPLFQRQYAEMKKVLVTDLGMTRFWMSYQEAINTIMLALSEDMVPGAIVVPPARAMTLQDVAKAATVDDVEIEVIGTRPGEKKHEQLIHHSESVRAFRQGEYIVLLPVAVGELPNHLTEDRLFGLSSATPHYFMSTAEMRELIEEAKEV